MYVPVNEDTPVAWSTGCQLAKILITLLISDLITSVANLNDPSAIPALVGVIESGNMVPRRLAKYGSLALEPVIARATDQDWVARKCVMITLANMLSPANLQGVQQSVDLIRATWIVLSYNSVELFSPRLPKAVMSMRAPSTA